MALLAALIVVAYAAVEAPGATAAVPGEIGGTVTEAGSASPIEGAEVCAYGINGAEGFRCEFADLNGEYIIGELPPGEYEVVFSGRACVGGTCVVEWAERIYDEVKPGSTPTPVEVEAGQRTQEIDAALPKLGSLEGTLTSSAGGPIAHALVCVDSTTEYHPACGVADPLGHYTVGALPPGEYVIEFTGLVCASGSVTDCPSEAECLEAATCTRPYVPQYYLEHPRIDETLDKVTVESSLPTVVDATLEPGGRVEGRLTVDAFGDPPAAGVRACVYSPGEVLREECARTNANGEYVIEGLGTGEWALAFHSEECDENGENCEEPFVEQWYDGQPDEEAATLFHLTAPGAKVVDASLNVKAVRRPGFLAGPTLSGGVDVGGTLSCAPGRWSNYPTAVSYAWRRDGVELLGQSAGTYTVTSADQGTSLACSVTIGNSAGSVDATSNALAIPAPAVEPPPATPSVVPPPPAVPPAPPHGRASAPAKVKVRNGRVRIRLSCTGAGACKGKLKLTYETKTKRGRRKAVFASGSFSIPACAHRTLSLKVTTRGSKRIGKAGKHGLKVRLTGTGLKPRTLTVEP